MIIVRVGLFYIPCYSDLVSRNQKIVRKCFQVHKYEEYPQLLYSILQRDGYYSHTDTLLYFMVENRSIYANFISCYLDSFPVELHFYPYIITNIQCLGITKQQESGCITINMKNYHNLLISSSRGWIYWSRRAFDIIFLVDIGPATLFSIYCYSDLVSWDHKTVRKALSS